MMSRAQIRFALLLAGVALATGLGACKNKTEPKPEPGEVVVDVQDNSAQPTPTDPAPAPPSAGTSDAAPHEMPAQMDPEEVDGWRPSWWLEDPMKTQQHAVACAYATEAELSKARAAGVDSARQKLKLLLGREPGMTEMKTDALRMPDGKFRAFVLIQTPLK